MEVRKDFGDRLAASCHAIPKEALHMLLKAVLPKTVATSTKAPQPRAEMWMGPDGLPQPHMKAPSRDGKWADKAAAKGKLKTRKPKVPRWNILKINAHLNHATKSDRHWMAKAATWCAAPPIGPRNAYGAQNLLNEWGKSGVKLDIAWLVRQGYIELVEGED